MRAFIVAVLLCSTHAVNAQEPSRVEIESALTRLLWAEVGPDRVLDHTVILFAIHKLDTQERRSTNVIETMNIHIPWWKRGAPPRRPWIAGLNTSCTEPAGFKLNWDVNRRWCYLIVKRIRDYYAGRLRNPCKGTPNNWRARGKPSRKAKRLYYQVGCGRKSRHNWFDTWRKPNGKPTRTIQNRRRRNRP